MKYEPIMVGHGTIVPNVDAMVDGSVHTLTPLTVQTIMTLIVLIIMTIMMLLTCIILQMIMVILLPHVADLQTEAAIVTICHHCINIPITFIIAAPDLSHHCHLGHHHRRNHHTVSNFAH
jgi:hypothetical protein